MERRKVGDQEGRNTGMKDRNKGGGIDKKEERERKEKEDEKEDRKTEWRNEGKKEKESTASLTSWLMQNHSS